MFLLRRIQPLLGFPLGPLFVAQGQRVDALEPSVAAPGPPIEALKPSAKAFKPPVKASQPPVEASKPPIEASKPPVEASELSSPEVQRRGYAPVNYCDNDTYPYNPVCQLGHGDYGFVIKVKHRETGEVFTCKEPRSRPDNRDTQDKLREEARIIRMLRHRHVVGVVETYMVGSNLRIIMSPVGDMDLKELFLSDTNKLHEYRPLLKRAFGCLAYALAFIHREKVRHKGN